MLYLIGLGLNEKSITREAFETLKKCKKIYLEGYTIDFPYEFSELESQVGKFEVLSREDVESTKIIEEAKKKDVALLIYGSPLFATTHLTLLSDCRKVKVKTKIIYNASVFDAIGESGLELYKFGKITSMPKWQPNFEPDSFLDIVQQNSSIKAHSLILCDIKLSFQDALNQLEIACKKKKISLEKIIVCSNLGTQKAKIIYDTLENLKKKHKLIVNPFCLIIPSELHFMEKEALENL
jgi:diphthine synthase